MVRCAVKKLALSENINNVWKQIHSVSKSANSVGGGAINISKYQEDIPIVLVGSSASYQKIQQFHLPSTLTHTYFLKGNVASLRKFQNKLKKIQEGQAKIPNRYRCKS